LPCFRKNRQGSSNWMEVEAKSLERSLEYSEPLHQ